MSSRLLEGFPPLRAAPVNSASQVLLIAALLSAALALSSCGGGAVSASPERPKQIGSDAAEAAVRPVFERDSKFAEGSSSPAGHGDFDLFHCQHSHCVAEIHQGNNSPFIYLIAEYEVVREGSQLTPLLTGYSCPVNNSYCGFFELAAAAASSE